MVNINDLNWKRVDDDIEDLDDGFNDGTFYGLEEIENVDVIKEDGIVKFVPLSPSSSTNGTVKRIKNVKKSLKKQPESEQIKPKKKKLLKQESTGKQSMEKKPDDNSFLALANAKEDPVYSLGSWPANLNWRIYTGLRNCDLLTPTEIQKQSIPLIMAGHDVIGKAATGSGKTLAYAIPLLNRYYDSVESQDFSKRVQSNSDDPDHEQTLSNSTDVVQPQVSSNISRRPEGLVISPTRELAHQIRDHLQAIVPNEDKSKIVTFTGGLSLHKQLRQLGKSPAVVIATPGRLLEILEQMPCKQQHEWQHIPSLVLDEADRLVQSGSFVELESCLRVIGVSYKRQVLVYSATFSTELWGNLNSQSHKKRKHEDIRNIMQEKLGLNSNACMVDVDPKSQVAESVRQAIIECPNMEKDLYAYYFLLLYPGKSIVFVNSIDAVKRITPLLKELGITAFGVHSEMIQKQRLRSIERFRETPCATLIATDIAARGLDIPLVDHVIHYHLPRSGDMYVHRSGRTARAGNFGVSVALCSPQEASGPLPNLLKLISTKPKQIDIDYDVLGKLRNRVKLAKKIADTQSIATKKGKSENWLNDAAESLGIELDDDFSKLDRKGKNENSQREMGSLKEMRYELAQLLTQKLIPNRRYLTSGSSNLAHEMLKQSELGVLGKPTRSALQELAPKSSELTQNKDGKDHIDLNYATNSKGNYHDKYRENHVKPQLKRRKNYDKST